MTIRTVLALAACVLTSSEGLAAVAQAPNARLAGLIYVSEGTNLVQIQRRKNIQSVTHPDNGIFCIFPGSAATLSLTAIVPTVTAAASTAEYLALAFWDVTASDCPPNSIEVQTYLLNPGASFQRLNAAFTITVP